MPEGVGQAFLAVTGHEYERDTAAGEQRRDCIDPASMQVCIEQHRIEMPSLDELQCFLFRAYWWGNFSSCLPKGADEVEADQGLILDDKKTLASQQRVFGWSNCAVWFHGALRLWRGRRRSCCGSWKRKPNLPRHPLRFRHHLRATPFALGALLDEGSAKAPR